MTPSREDRERFAGLVALTRQRYPRETTEQAIARAREVDPELYHRVTGEPLQVKTQPNAGLRHAIGVMLAREACAKEKVALAAAKTDAQRRMAELQAQFKVAWNEGERLLKSAAVDEDADGARQVLQTPYYIRVPSSRAEIFGSLDACRQPLTRDEAVARLAAAEAERAASMPGYTS